MNTLHDTVTVLYGAAGTLGTATARVFAREGGHLVLAGRTREPLDALAREVEALGSSAEVAVVDATDEGAVRRHLDDVVARHGRLDVSLNLVTRGDVQGTPLLEMTADDLMAPIEAVRSVFVTARAAARHMTTAGRGCILFVTSGSGAVTKPDPAMAMGGTGPADAATESLLRYLAAEVGPAGVRVNGIWTAGVTYPEMMAQFSILRAGPTSEQFAEAAAFLASDRAGGTTNCILDASSGVCAP